MNPRLRNFMALPPVTQPQREAAADQERAATQFPAPPHQLEGFVAIPDNNTAVPPDSAGAVSQNYIVTVLNTEFRVQDRNGKDLRTLSVERFFAAAGPFETGVYDPRIVYDASARRWLSTILADGNGRTPALLLAVSENENPLGNWRVTRYLAPSAAGLSFDFPRIALSGPFLMISLNIYRGPLYENTLNSIFVLADIYRGGRTVQQYEDFLFTETPVEDSNRDARRAIFANTAFGVFDATLRLVFREVNLQANGAIAVGERRVIMAGELDSSFSPNILPQKDTPVLIEADNPDLADCTAQGDDIWCVGTNFLRFNTTRTSVVQLYTIKYALAPAMPTLGRIRIEDRAFLSFYAYPSIAVNKNKDIFIGYNRFRADQYAGAYFAYRRATDPLGGLYHDAVVKEGEDSYTKGGLRVRWGDYSSTIVDPTDDLSFWTLQEYAASRTEGGTSQRGTWWLKFQPRSTACTYQVDRSTVEVPSSASSFNIQLTTNVPDCTRLVAPNAAWLTTQTVSSPTGSATFVFRAELNRRSTARSATITLGTQSIRVNQAANPNPPPAEAVLRVTKFDAPVRVRVGDNVNLAATVRNAGSAGAATFRIGFYLSTRSTVTNQDIFTGFGCPINGGLVVDEVTDCQGSFQIPTTLAPGTYYIAAIADDRQQIMMTDRSASTRLSDAGALTVEAAANAPLISSGGLVHGASARAGALAPGLIFVLYGQRLGPAALTTLTLDANGRVATTLAGTQVLFDGVPAPMIYTSAGQISGIVPYAVAGKQEVQVEVVYNGLRGAFVRLPVASAAPALFTVDFSGANQVAALNENGSVNSAANPLAPGRIVVLYGTGAGTFRSQPIDGAVIGTPLPEFLQALTVEIGGQPAEILYAGPAPGLVSGVFQINARIPANVPPGAAPVVVKSGALSSPAGATLAIQ
ncbi:MAG: CARDB domain-containing protein [Bryobacter sp.]|nr:CARDB domain-containing protein [Bryobacter sp.]